MKKTKPKAKAKPKVKEDSPPAETPDPLKAVMKWILQGNEAGDVQEAIKKNYPGADEKALVAAAIDEITEIGNETPEFTRGWALASTRELVRKMIEVGDFANAMRGIKQIHDLAGD